MSFCEDYPCCGHEHGDCPDSQGRMTCVCCGQRLPINAPSSICDRCMREERFLDPEDRSDYGIDPNEK